MKTVEFNPPKWYDKPCIETERDYEPTEKNNDRDAGLRHDGRLRR